MMRFLIEFYFYFCIYLRLKGLLLKIEFPSIFDILLITGFVRCGSTSFLFAPYCPTKVEFKIPIYHACN